jgi:hypothetical protein
MALGHTSQTTITQPSLLRLVTSSNCRYSSAPEPPEFSQAPLFWRPSQDSSNQVKVKVILRQTVSRPVCLDVRHPSGTHGQFFSFFLYIFFDSYRFLDVGRPLWREVRSVAFSFCWVSPAEPFSELSPMGLMSILYCLYFWDSLNLKGQVPVHLVTIHELKVSIIDI